MAPRGILKAPSVFPLEHEFPGYEEPHKIRSRSRSRDRRHADELAVVPSGHHHERPTVVISSRTRTRTRSRSRHRSKSRSRRHIRWSEPVAFVVSDGRDGLVQELRHRRSSLPTILEDTRALFRQSLRENDKKEGRSSDKDPSSSRRAPDTFHPSSRKRPSLKPTLSTPDVGRGSQIVPSPKVVEPPLHAPTPISHEHRRRRTSLPNGLEAALKASSHALWLPHHGEEHSREHSSSHGKGESSQTNGHSTSHSRSSNSVSHSHARVSSNRSHASHSQTPRHHDNIQLPPHAHEQPQLRGGSSSAPPPVTFLNPQHSTPMTRPISQITTSSHVTAASHKSSHSKSSKSSKSSRSSQEKATPPLPSPVPSTKPSIEPQTPKSTRSNPISFPTIDDLFSKDETSHSSKSIRRLFGLSTPKHEPRKLPDDDELPVKKSKHSRESSKDIRDADSARHRTDSFVVKPPARETLHRARHSFDLGTFSLLDDMHMRWTTATARHFLPVLTPAEIQASHLTLSLNPALTTIHWDIRHPPNAVWSIVPGRKSVLWTGHNEPATVPLVPSLRIFSPYFPWVVSARNPAGVTCGDILSAIHTSALQLVWRGEFDPLRAEDKSRLAAGYHANRPAKGAHKSADAPFDAGSWLVRADWLGRHTVLRGMSVSEGKDQYGSPSPEVLLSMYLTENRRETDRPVLPVPHH